MDPDDPMAFLNAQREKLAAMSAMGEVAALQSNLVNTVQERMKKIKELESGKSKSPRVDPEVEMWKKKIASLVNAGPKPTSASSSSNTPPPPRQRQSKKKSREPSSTKVSSRARARSPRSNPESSSLSSSSGTSGASLSSRSSGSALSGIQRKNKISSSVSRSKKGSTSVSLSWSSSQTQPPLELSSDAAKTLLSSSPNRAPDRKEKRDSRTSSTKTSRMARTSSAPTSPSHPLVQSVEAKINKINNTRSKGGKDPEVEMWKKKIAALSAVNPTKSYTSPLKVTGFSPTSARGSGLDAVKRRAKRNSSV
ncbi:hypothetical protein TrVE_jg5458 [Triparma verrucosa]|uniref:Uncharacterized protein n=1 Tax=Triparma verrucosa TaxID=1606542 RepID=A0A9W7ELU4_9STRA|nr:hypothetical protein TrVE_jg5458 [Triparma verrucosa]